MSLVDTKGLNDAAQSAAESIKKALSGFDPAQTSAILAAVATDMGVVTEVVKEIGADLDTVAKQVSTLAASVDNFLKDLRERGILIQIGPAKP